MFSPTWFAAGAVLVGAFVSIFRPDNQACPVNLSPGARSLLTAGLGVVQATLQAVYGGASWPDAIITALASATAVMAVHGAAGAPKPSGNNVSGPAKPSQAGFVRINAMLSILGVTSLGIAIACAKLAPVVPAVEQCVAAALVDASNGQTLQQIVSNEAACAGVSIVEIVTALLSSTDNAVTNSQAFKDAEQYLFSHPGDFKITVATHKDGGH